MHRRDLLRRTLLGSVGLAATTAVEARELPPNLDASKDLARPDWKPTLLDAHQNETLIALSDLIIPATETPGAKDALVNRFLDGLMAVEIADTQREFLAALAWIDGESRKRYNAAFIYVPREQQIEFLTLFAYPESLSTWGEESRTNSAKTAHFDKLKGWISGAYYSSEAGLRELGWDGEFPHGTLTGCEPGEHPVHEIKPATGGRAKG